MSDYFDVIDTSITDTDKEVSELEQAKPVETSVAEKQPFTDTFTLKAAQLFDTAGTALDRLGFMDYDSLAPELRQEVQDIAHKEHGINIENSIDGATDLVAGLPADVLTGMTGLKAYNILAPIVGKGTASMVGGIIENTGADLLRQNLIDNESENALDIKDEALGTSVLAGAALGKVMDTASKLLKGKDPKADTESSFTQQDFNDKYVGKPNEDRGYKYFTDKEVDELTNFNDGIENPEIVIKDENGNAYEFPDEEITTVRGIDEPQENVNPATKLGDKETKPTEDVIRENIAKPNKKEYDILNDTTSDEFLPLMQKKIENDLGYPEIKTDEFGNPTPQSKQEYFDFKTKVNAILNDDKALEVYRKQFVDEVKQKRNVADAEGPKIGDSTSTKRPDSATKNRQKRNKKKSQEELEKRQPEQEYTHGESYDKYKSQKQLKQEASRKKIEAKAKENGTSDEFSINKGQESNIHYNDEVTTKVYDDSAIDLKTDREFLGSKPPEKTSTIKPERETDIDSLLQYRKKQRQEILDTEFKTPEARANASKKVKDIDNEISHLNKIKRDDVAVNENNLRTARENGANWKKENIDATEGQAQARAYDEMQNVPDGFDKEAMAREFYEGTKLHKPSNSKNVRTPEEAKANAEILRKKEEQRQKNIEAKKQREAAQSKEEPTPEPKPKKRSFTLKEANTEGLIPDELMDVYNKIAGKHGDVKIVLDEDLVHPSTGKKSDGFYNSNTNEIHINPKSLRKNNGGHSVVHEAIHAATFKEIRKRPELRAEANKLFSEAKKAYYAKNGTKGEAPYWMKNLDEFISEGISNPKLNKALKNVKSGDKTLWDKFKGLIHKALGIDPKDVSIASKLDDILDKSLAGETVSRTKKYTDKMTNLMSDIHNSPSAENYRKLHVATKKAFDEASRYKDITKNMVDTELKKYGSEAKSMNNKLYKHLLQTDFQSIEKFKNSADANKYIADKLPIYNKYKKEINLLAKSMKDSSGMNDIEWRGNGYAIMRKHGDTPTKDMVDTIERLASVRAMTKKDWDFVTKLRTDDKKLYDTAINLMREKNELSAEQFKSNPHDRIKGYASESYDQIVTEFGYRRGALPTDIQSATKGEVTHFKDKYTDDEAFAQRAKKRGEGLVLKEFDNAIQIVGSRKVDSEFHKVSQLRKDTGFSDVISNTLSTSVRKTNINSDVMNTLNEVLSKPDNGVFNGKGKDFRPLTDEEISSLPKQMRSVITNVHKDYAGQLLGNYEVGFKGANQAVVLGQLFIKDMAGQFKEAVVFKNPTSYVNNFMFNFAIGKQNGMDMKTMFKYQSQARKEFSYVQSLQKEYVERIIRGEDTTSVVNKMKDTDMYKYQQEGMATSVLADITSNPSYSNRMSEKMLKRVVEGIVGKGDVADKIANASANVYLSPSSTTGKHLLNLFTKIDVSGRYMMTKHFVDQGYTLNQAVNKSNGIFGDLDKLSPKWVQGISEFGAIPFGNWFYRVSGGMTTNVKENAVRAVMLGATLYGAEQAFGKRTESFNPMLTILNSPGDMLMMSPYLNMGKTAERVAVPAAYDKAINMKNPIISDSF